MQGNGTIFLGGPPLVKRPPAKMSAGGWAGRMCITRLSGVADHFAEDETEALEKVREIVAHLNRRKR
ncbi:MAG: hypothetical protein M5U34_46030 [Chloroflexi bacterium]|nr:hypothetical protein [Chloroflexota bacterium]